MAIGSGLGSSFGFSAESTFGTYVAPTKWIEGTAKLEKVKNTYQGGGMAAGRFVQPSGRRYVTSKGAQGSVESAVYSKSMGVLLNSIFGGTVTPVQQGATAAYLQTHTLSDPFGKMLTMQAGVPTLDGTVNPYSYLGCQINSAEFSVDLNQSLMMTLDVSARDVTEAQALAAPTYPVCNEFHWGQAALKLGTFGAETQVDGITKMTLKIERPKHPGGPYMGNAGLISQRVSNDWVKISGTIEADFVTKTALADRYRDDSGVSMVWEFVGPLIASTFFETFRITVPATFFDGATPKAESPDVVKGPFPFVGQFDLTNNPCTVAYISTDTAL